jgi:hypothetical protein
MDMLLDAPMRFISSENAHAGGSTINGCANDAFFAALDRLPRACVGTRLVSVTGASFIFAPFSAIKRLASLPV